MGKFLIKAQLGKTVKMCKDWTWYFCGFTIGQYGFGIIWRNKDKPINWTSEHWFDQQNFDIEEIV
jgi:hypothetical protein